MKNGWQILIAAVFGLLGAGVLLLVNTAPRGEPVRLAPLPTPAHVTVH